MKILFLPAYFHPEMAGSGYLGQNRAEAFARQGYHMEVYAPMPTRGVSPKIRREYKLFDRYKLDRAAFYATYCGNIGLTQNMPLLLEVAEELQTVPDLKFVLIGEGACRQEVEARIAERELANVVLLPFQPCEDLSHVFSLGDAGLVLSKPGVGENSVPSKTWSIMSAERPVVASFDENELREILLQNQCGLFAKAGDRGGLKEAILSLYRDRARCRQLGKNGRKFIVEHLSREAGTAQSVAVVKEFAKKISAPVLT